MVEYNPAPGQFVNHPSFNDPTRAIGPPIGGGTGDANNDSQVTLGGFGGSIVLSFDHTVLDDAANPLGLDAIVYGNSFFVGGDPNRRWAECAHIEISVDAETWYLIPGSHIADPAGQFQSQSWDDDFESELPPANPNWIPPGMEGQWETSGYLLPAETFTPVVENPHGPNAEDEGIYGYADYTPTLLLGDMSGDDTVDDDTVSPEAFYTSPDDPFRVGIRLGSGGGDAFDIAWAIDPVSGESAGIDGFRFIRITSGVNVVMGGLGEVSAEIDAVADVAPGLIGDFDADGDLDLWDFAAFVACAEVNSDEDDWSLCRVMDFDGDSDVDLIDFAGFQTGFTGSP